MKKMLSKLFAIGLACSLILVGCGQSSSGSGGSSADGIKVGVLFSTSGATAVGEKGMINATMMAIEEINAKGGVNGKKLIPVQEDYASDPAQAATKAKKLLLQDKVAAIIGTYTSASRQAALPVVEQNKGVLIYPVLWEGEEYSKNIIYTGPVPNQQLESFIPWLVKNKGKKFYFIGSDYVYPVETNKQVKELLKKNGAEVIGEDYVPLGQSEFASNINKIKSAKPDVIFSTLVGDSISAFYKQYKNYGLNPAQMPIASAVTAETDVVSMGADVAEGHIASSAYFQSLNTPENKKFVEAYHAKYGANEPISFMVESSYFSTYLLAEALKKAGDKMNNANDLIKAFAGLEFQAPEGKVKVDPENNNTWLNSYIGVVKNGQFDIVQKSDQSIYPQPWSKLLFPDHKEPWK